MSLWNRSGIISSVEGIWLDVPLTQSLVISHNFFATARKIIYAACSIQAGRFFYCSKLTMLRSTSPAVPSKTEAPCPFFSVRDEMNLCLQPHDFLSCMRKLRQHLSRKTPLPVLETKRYFLLFRGNSFDL